MKVGLEGDAFDIKALSTEEQTVPAQGFTEWDWNVTPTQSGMQTLSLRVTAVVAVPGAEGEKDLPIIERQIQVTVNPGYSFNSWLRDNRWIYPAVLGPPLGGLWIWLRKKWPKGHNQPGGSGAGGDAAHT